MNGRYRFNKDMIFILIGALIVYFSSLIFDPFDRIMDFLTIHESWQIDEFFILFAYATIALCIFSYRRWQDADREIEFRNELENDLLKAKNEAEQAKTSTNKFLVDMSHELRTPLNSIIGFSDMLLDGMVGELNERQKDYVNTITKSGTHLLHLIDQLLDLAKIESGKVELNIEEFELQALVDEVGSIIAALTKKKTIQLSYQLDTNIGMIKGDRLKIKQILFNLASNAIKFTPEKGSVIITAEKIPDNKMLLKVSDTGPGIESEDLERIFHPFEQLDTMEETGYKGTGLGLSIVQDLVLLHQGKVWVESVPGKGSVFYVELPLSLSNG